MLGQRQSTAEYRTYRLVGLVLAPLAFAAMALSPPPDGLSPAG
jgi:hypothetical protein